MAKGSSSLNLSPFLVLKSHATWLQFINREIFEMRERLSFSFRVFRVFRGYLLRLCRYQPPQTSFVMKTLFGSSM